MCVSTITPSNDIIYSSGFEEISTQVLRVMFHKAKKKYRILITYFNLSSSNQRDGGTLTDRMFDRNIVQSNYITKLLGFV